MEVTTAFCNLRYFVLGINCPCPGAIKMSCHVVAGVNGDSSEIDLQWRGVTRSRLQCLISTIQSVTGCAFSNKNVY